MITLYRQPENAAADEAQERLRELVLAHEVVVVNAERPAALPAGVALPVLVEGDDLYAEHEMDAFLEKRSNRLRISRSMSADACFLDPDDPTQCI